MATETEASPTAVLEKLDLGAVLLGCVIQAIFFGNSLSLVWRYFTKCRAEDPWWFSACIGVAWALCTFSVVITTDAVWYFVYGDLFQEAGVIPPWTVDFFLLVNSLVAVLVRLLYVYRLGKLCLSSYHLRGRTFSAAILVLTTLLSLLDLASSVMLCVRLYQTEGATDMKDYGSYKDIFHLAFAAGIAADATLTGLMCVWLHSTRTGYQQRTDSRLNTLVVYTVQTGLFPGVIETAGMISFLAMSQSKLFLGFYVQVGILYLTSLLTSLNARRSVQHRIQQPISVNFSVLDRPIIAPAPGPPPVRAPSLPLPLPSPGIDADADVQTLNIPDADAEQYEEDFKETAPDVGRRQQQHGCSEEKVMTPDCERPQEELERLQLGSGARVACERVCASAAAGVHASRVPSA